MCPPGCMILCAPRSRCDGHLARSWEWGGRTSPLRRRCKPRNLACLSVFKHRQDVGWIEGRGFLAVCYEDDVGIGPEMLAEAGPVKHLCDLNGVLPAHPAVYLGEGAEEVAVVFADFHRADRNQRAVGPRIEPQTTFDPQGSSRRARFAPRGRISGGLRGLVAPLVVFGHPCFADVEDDQAS